MNGILIDTNIYSEAMRGNAAVVDTLRRVPHIGFSSISVGELLSGFKSGNREQKNRRELVAFLDSPRVMLYPVVEDTAEQYSSVQHHLRKKGTPIPTNDIWIAAVSLQHGLPIYTMDKHFKQVDGLIFHVSGK
ncbi:MAG: type II toxin-antitoxin system VapC family toxin [Candidatus Electrothrix communis]|nr:MAG: type II toxin-antitoxin system VapC family toxin [Candidatus Electrothrix communis]